MIQRFRPWIFATLFTMATAHAAEITTVRPVLKGEVVQVNFRDGYDVSLWGTNVTYPAPTLFVFSATIEESLGDPYYRQCGNRLAEKGFLLASLDLPGHGTAHRENEPEGLAAWRHRSDREDHFVSRFTTNFKIILDLLIENGYSDPARIAVCGTSRGGFMALQATAVDQRIRATAAFAPVTALSALREFKGASNTDHIDALSLYSRANRLAGRSLWLVIGDRDERVGTDDCIAFARRVTTLSLEQSKPADVTLIVQPEPKGHTTPEGSPDKAAEWILSRLE